MRWFLKNHWNMCQHNPYQTLSRTLTETSGGVGGIVAIDSGGGSAEGSIMGSGLDTQTWMTDLRPEVPVATYLASFFANKWKPWGRI